MGGQDLHAAVPILGMGVQHSTGQLHQLAHVAHQQRASKPQLTAQIHAVTDEVGHLHRPVRVQAQAPPDKVRAVVPRGQQGVGRPLLPPLAQLHRDGVHQGLLAHGLHDARGAQNGDAPLDAQPGVEGPLGQGLPLRRGDDHPQSAPVVRQRLNLLHARPDHLPGHAVDGRRAHRLVQARGRHPAHPLSAVDVHAAAVPTGDPGNNGGPVGHVRIVPRVLPHGALGPVLPGPGLLHRQIQQDAAGGAQGYCVRSAARQQQECRRLGRRRRAGAGGVPQTQPLSFLYHVLLHQPRLSRRRARHAS